MPDTIAVSDAQKKAKETTNKPTDPKSAYDAVKDAQRLIYQQLNPYLVH